jgi:hypothetical protein
VNTRSRDVGHATIDEAQPRVGDVDLGRKHCRAHGVQRLDVAAHDALHDVDVVDHQVEHHVDVGAALLEWRQPLAFDEARRSQQRLGRDHRGIEAFQVAHLQHAAVAFGELQQRARLRHRDGDGFFHQHMDAAGEQRAGDLVMQRRRRDHAGDVNAPGQRAVVGQRLAADLGRHPLRDSGLAVDHRHQAAAWRSRVLLRVEAPQISRANDGCTQFTHHGYYAHTRNPT